MQFINKNTIKQNQAKNISIFIHCICFYKSLIVVIKRAICPQKTKTNIIDIIKPPNYE